MKNYPYRHSEMLLTAKTIAESFNEHIDKLAEMRTNWTPEYADDLRKRIDDAIDNYLEIDRTKKLREATAYLSSIQDPALKDLSAFRIQVVIDFGEESNAILRSLGYDYHYEDAKRNKSQESLIQLLASFKLSMNDKLKTKLTSKGMNPALIENIISYADNMKQANARQEMHKDTQTIITKEIHDILNDIYSEVIGICKIAYGALAFDPVIRRLFSFQRIARNMTNVHTSDEEISV